MKTGTTTALLMPGDDPPSLGSVRRLLLFFDRVVLPAPEDSTLIGSREIIERFPGGGVRQIEWAAQFHFPRRPGYELDTQSLVQSLGPARSRNLVSVLPVRGQVLGHPRRRLELYSAAIATRDLVRAAIPDFSLAIAPLVPRSTLLTGGGLTKSGHRSEYAVEFKEPVELSESAPWTHAAWLRLARALKYLEAARLSRFIPVCVDEVNSSIAWAVLGQGLAGMPALSGLEAAAVPGGVSEPAEVDDRLGEMSWEEVLELRRQVLPAAAKVQRSLRDATHRLGPLAGYRDYEAAMSSLRSSIEAAKNEFRDAAASLRLATVLKLGAGFGGANLLIGPQSLEAAFLAALSGALVTAGALTREITSYYRAKRQLTMHPLVFFDRMPRPKESR